MPMIWSGVYPGHSVMMPDVDVVDTEAVVTTDLQQALSILIHLSYSEMTQTVRPRVVVGTHSYT